MASNAYATDLGSTMSHVSSESIRDSAAGMSHSHNADGSKRGKAEGQAISSRSSRSGAGGTSNSNSTNNSVHLITKPHQLHKNRKLQETGSYAETCFTGDTTVVLSKVERTELVQIKDVQVGDFVFSCALEDGSKQCRPRKVLAKSEVLFEDQLLAISLSKGQITTTFEHKFYVVDEGWVPAEELSLGDHLLSESGEIVNIENLEPIDNIEESVLVYDLKVEAEGDDCNYYVGADRVLVHNCDIAIAGMPASIMGGSTVAVTGTVVRGWMKQVAGAGAGLGMMNRADEELSKNFKGKQTRGQRLKDLKEDEKVSSADRGWITQELNEVKQGKKSHLRNPPGKDLAHERGREAAKGYGYEHAHIRDRKDHKKQHKYDNWGKKNKEREFKK